MTLASGIVQRSSSDWSCGVDGIGNEFVISSCAFELSAHWAFRGLCSCDAEGDAPEDGETEDVMPGCDTWDAVDFARCGDGGDGLQAGPVMVVLQPADIGADPCCADLDPAMIDVNHLEEIDLFFVAGIIREKTDRPSNIASLRSLRVKERRRALPLMAMTSSNPSENRQSEWETKILIHQLSKAVPLGHSPLGVAAPPVPRIKLTAVILNV